MKREVIVVTDNEGNDQVNNSFKKLAEMDQQFMREAAAEIDLAATTFNLEDALKKNKNIFGKILDINANLITPILEKLYACKYLKRIEFSFPETVATGINRQSIVNKIVTAMIDIQVADETAKPAIQIRGLLIPSSFLIMITKKLKNLDEGETVNFSSLELCDINNMVHLQEKTKAELDNLKNALHERGAILIYHFHQQRSQSAIPFYTSNISTSQSSSVTKQNTSPSMHSHDPYFSMESDTNIGGSIAHPLMPRFSSNFSVSNSVSRPSANKPRINRGVDSDFLTGDPSSGGNSVPQSFVGLIVSDHLQPTYQRPTINSLLPTTDVPGTFPSYAFTSPSSFPSTFSVASAPSESLSTASVSSPSSISTVSHSSSTVKSKKRPLRDTPHQSLMVSDSLFRRTSATSDDSSMNNSSFDFTSSAFTSCSTSTTSSDPSLMSTDSQRVNDSIGSRDFSSENETVPPSLSATPDFSSASGIPSATPSSDTSLPNIPSSATMSSRIFTNDRSRRMSAPSAPGQPQPLSLLFSSTEKLRFKKIKIKQEQPEENEDEKAIPFDHPRTLTQTPGIHPISRTERTEACKAIRGNRYAGQDCINLSSLICEYFTTKKIPERSSEPFRLRKSDLRVFATYEHIEITNKKTGVKSTIEAITDVKYKQEDTSRTLLLPPAESKELSPSGEMRDVIDPENTKYHRAHYEEVSEQLKNIVRANGNVGFGRLGIYPVGTKNPSNKIVAHEVAWYGWYDINTSQFELVFYDMQAIKGGKETPGLKSEYSNITEEYDFESGKEWGPFCFFMVDGPVLLPQKVVDGAPAPQKQSLPVPNPRPKDKDDHDTETTVDMMGNMRFTPS